MPHLDTVNNRCPHGATITLPLAAQPATVSGGLFGTKNRRPARVGALEAAP